MPEAPAPDDLRLLLLIRHFEQALLKLFADGLLNGTTHTCIGQEEVPVAVSALLRDDDVVFSNHRGHGHYLARYGDPVPLLAEILGREGALGHGVGGSQHVRRDAYYSTGVQGESLPVAVGVALHQRRIGAGGIALTYVGDGTFGQGAVYEALNMAALWRVPLVVIVENNGIAQTTPTAVHLAGSIAGRAAAFGIDHHLCAPGDLGSVRAALRERLPSVRDGGGPLVIECLVNRLGPHSKGDDTRSPALLRELRELDWYLNCRRNLGEAFVQADTAVREAVDAAVAKVLDRAPSRWEAAAR